MSIDLFINTEAESIERAVVSGLGSPQSPVSVREFVQGLEQDFNLYLIDPDGSYDARSGTDTPVKVSVSVRGGYPSQGEYVATDDSGDTSTIAHDASAATVEAALNAMNSDTGPQGGLVDVTKKGHGCYLIVWREVGVRAALTGTSQTLSPESTVEGSISVTGSATVRCQQILELKMQPIIFSETWTQITNGWSGTLNANNGRAIQALGDSEELPVFIEVSVDGICLAQSDTRLLASVGGQLAQAAPPLPSATLDWGQIEGTLANQADLQSALDLKSDVTDVDSYFTDPNNNDNFNALYWLSVGLGIVNPSTGGGMLGTDAVATGGGGAVGNSATATGGGGAVGDGATATGGFSGGKDAESGTGAVQLGEGSNYAFNTFQFRSSGAITETQFGYVSSMTEQPLDSATGYTQAAADAAFAAIDDALVTHVEPTVEQSGIRPYQYPRHAKRGPSIAAKHLQVINESGYTIYARRANAGVWSDALEYQGVWDASTNAAPVGYASLVSLEVGAYWIAGDPTGTGSNQDVIGSFTPPGGGSAYSVKTGDILVYCGDRAATPTDSDNDIIWRLYSQTAGNYICRDSDFDASAGVLPGVFAPSGNFTTVGGANLENIFATTETSIWAENTQGNTPTGSAYHNHVITAEDGELLLWTGEIERLSGSSDLKLAIYNSAYSRQAREINFSGSGQVSAIFMLRQAFSAETIRAKVQALDASEFRATNMRLQRYYPAGHYAIVTTAGSIDGIDYRVGDWAVSNGDGTFYRIAKLPEKSIADGAVADLVCTNRASDWEFFHKEASATNMRLDLESIEDRVIEATVTDGAITLIDDGASVNITGTDGAVNSDPDFIDGGMYLTWTADGSTVGVSIAETEQFPTIGTNVPLDPSTDLAVYGDSLAYQLAPFIATAYGGRTVTNRGYGGRYSSDVLNGIKNDALRGLGYDAETWILWAGANDGPSRSSAVIGTMREIKSWQRVLNKRIVALVPSPAGNYMSFEDNGAATEFESLTFDRGLHTDWGGYYKDLERAYPAVFGTANTVSAYDVLMAGLVSQSLADTPDPRFPGMTQLEVARTFRVTPWAYSGTLNSSDASPITDSTNFLRTSFQGFVSAAPTPTNNQYDYWIVSAGFDTSTDITPNSVTLSIGSIIWDDGAGNLVACKPDSVHPNTAGRDLITTAIQSIITANGW